ncbi:MAG TPA: hypothetical protein VFH54_09115 [Mycobacteriales bacterium]|nr:hypothetical protein [Mycobacteriales bacterium]
MRATTMRRPGLHQLAWGAGALGVGFVVVAAVFFAAGGHRVHNLYGNEAAIGLGFTVVGAVVAARVPQNSLGWLLLAVGLVHASGLASIEYLSWLGLHRVHEVPVGFVIFAEMSWLPGVITLFTLVPLLFPTGRPLPGRWRWLVWAVGFSTVVAVFGVLTNTREWPDFHVANPAYSPTIGQAGGPAFPLMLLTAIGCIASIIVRYRRAGGALRDQLRLFVWAATMGSAVVAVLIITNAHNTVTVLLQFAAVFAFPLSIGAAILRYRLYDIDRIVSRTVSYAVITGLLVGVYIGCVTLTTRLMPLSSAVGVAASTLIAAALFQPLRRRIQHAVDRRFNRQRYDAGKTVDVFASRLRDVVDPDLVRSDLLLVAAQAMQPATMSLWVAS